MHTNQVSMDFNWLNKLHKTIPHMQNCNRTGLYRGIRAGSQVIHAAKHQSRSYESCFANYASFRAAVVMKIYLSVFEVRSSEQRKVSAIFLHNSDLGRNQVIISSSKLRLLKVTQLLSQSINLRFFGRYIFLI